MNRHCRSSWTGAPGNRNVRNDSRNRDEDLLVPDLALKLASQVCEQPASSVSRCSQVLARLSCFNCSLARCSLSRLPHATVHTGSVGSHSARRLGPMGIQ